MKRLLTITYFTSCFVLFSTVCSLAYLDPGTTTYMIQLVAGGLIAAGAAVGIYWYKFKNKVKKVAKGRDASQPEVAAQSTEQAEALAKSRAAAAAAAVAEEEDREE